MDNPAKKTIKYLKDISPKAWEHPADRAALNALRQIPGLDQILKVIVGATAEKKYRLFMLASTVRTSEKQFPKMHRLFTEACSRLDLRTIPELYISQSPFLNAGAIGVDKPFIVLYSGVFKHLSDMEIMSVLGHEIGHCMSGHVLYKTMLWILLHIPLMLIDLPVAQIALRLIMLALLEWSRKSELSADRAGLLAVQSPQDCYTLEMKMAGGGDLSQMDINEFFLQAADYDKGGDLLDSVFKLFNLAGEDHPFAVLRLTELKTWVDGGHYDKILSGEYKRQTDGEPDDVMNDFKKAQEQYKEDMKNSKDPLAAAMTDVMKNIEPVTKKIEEFFNGIFSPGEIKKDEDHKDDSKDE